MNNKVNHEIEQLIIAIIIMIALVVVVLIGVAHQNHGENI